MAGRQLGADRLEGGLRSEDGLIGGPAEVEVQGAGAGQVGRIDLADDRTAAGTGLQVDEALDLRSRSASRTEARLAW